MCLSGGQLGRSMPNEKFDDFFPSMKGIYIAIIAQVWLIFVTLFTRILKDFWILREFTFLVNFAVYF